MIVSLWFVSNASAHHVPVVGFDNHHHGYKGKKPDVPDLNVLFLKRCMFERDWVNDAIVDDGFYASGDLYIDYDYFLANQSKGLEFKAKGSLFFLPSEDDLDIPEFDKFDDELNIAYEFDKPFVNYWIGEDSVLDVDFFFSKKNIYIINGPAPSQVPVPAAAWLFGSALTVLAQARRSSRKVNAVAM